MVQRFFALAVVLTVFPSFAARVYRGGAVAAAHPAGSKAGLEMLDKGGNAVDAAVAAAFTMGVVGPYHSGLGGGGFAVIHDVSKGDAALDFREVAPAKATREMFMKDGKPDPKLSQDGALSIAVPGAVAGYLSLHEKYGKLPRAVVLAPALRAAKDGFAVTPKYRALARDREECLSANAEATKIFGGDLEVGTLLKQPDLAKTLAILSKEGAKPFYTGALAKALVAGVQSAGGLLSADDLAGYKVKWGAPLEGRYRSHRVLTMPPPSAGGLAVLQVLGILERLGPSGLASRDVAVLHHFVEGLRRSYKDRADFLGDPDVVDVPLERLLSSAHLDAMKLSINPSRATPSRTLGGLPPESDKKHTTHISVIDKAGNAVALTTTINYYFGSCIVAPGTGVLLNDEMDDFAAQPGTPNVYGLVTGEANAVAPGKIPLSSMSPTLVFQKDRPKDVMLAVGSPGGSTIPTTVMQVISHIVDARLDVVRAVGMGRIHHQYLPDAISVDRTGLDPKTAEALAAMGHSLKFTDGWGDAEAVLLDGATGLVSAASDPRNEGAPAGQE